MMTTDVLVIGAGPGGYVAAIRAAQLGQKVTIVETASIGGACLNVGCIPSKALITAGHRLKEAQESDFLGIQSKETTLDFNKMQQWKNEKVVNTLTSGIEMLLKKNGVFIINGYARFIGKYKVEVETSSAAKELIEFQSAIIATGSRPIEIKGFPFGKRIIDSTGALNLKELPKKMVVVGGGYIGCELAGAYANLGTEVIIIEGSPSILPSFEEDLRDLVVNNFKKKGVSIFTDTKAIMAKESTNHVLVELEREGKRQQIKADYVMVTVGRQPNTEQLGLETLGIETNQKGLISTDEQYRTSQKHIYAIGDVVAGPALAHKASYEAKVASEVIAGKDVVKDYLTIPAICFTDPEIATTGLTLSDALTQGKKAKTTTFPMQANGRALSLNATEGFIRIVFEEETTLILGAQIAGVNASELIAELTLAIESYLTLEDVALTIHGHPTLSEMIMDATELGLGLPIHL